MKLLFCVLRLKIKNKQTSFLASSQFRVCIMGLNPSVAHLVVSDIVSLSLVFAKLHLPVAKLISCASIVLSTSTDIMRIVSSLMLCTSIKLSIRWSNFEVSCLHVCYLCRVLSNFASLSRRSKFRLLLSDSVQIAVANIEVRASQEGIKCWVKTFVNLFSSVMSV